MIHELKKNALVLWDEELRAMFFQIGLVLVGCVILSVILFTTVHFVDPGSFEEINVEFAGFIRR